MKTAVKGYRIINGVRTNGLFLFRAFFSFN